MPRGRLLRTKVREAREIAKATVIGELKGKMQVERVKYNARNIGLELKKRLLEADPDDISKTIAILGITATIKRGIDWTQEIKERYDLPFTFGLGAATPTKGLKLFDFGDIGDLGGEVVEWIISFGLAYLIVENFGLIVSTVGTGLSSVVGIARTLLGVGGLAPT